MHHYDCVAPNSRWKDYVVLLSCRFHKDVEIAASNRSQKFVIWQSLLMTCNKSSELTQKGHAQDLMGRDETRNVNVPKQRWPRVGSGVRRQLNQSSFVLLCYVLFAFSELCLVCCIVCVFSLSFFLSCIFQREPT